MNTGSPSCRWLRNSLKTLNSYTFVHHRVDGLERNTRIFNFIEVHHRVDGLENSYFQRQKFVHHRVDGLENILFQNNAMPTVHHRVDGLETYHDGVISKI